MKTLFFLIIICIPVFLFSDFNISKVKTNLPINEANSFPIPQKNKKLISVKKARNAKKVEKKPKKTYYPTPIISTYIDAEKKITVLKNQNNILPFKKLNKRFLILSLIENDSIFNNTFHLFANFQKIKIDDLQNLVGIVDSSDQLIILCKNKHIESLTRNILNSRFSKLNCNKNLILFDSPNLFNSTINNNFNTIVVGFSTNKFSQNRSAQLLFGAIPAIGKLEDKIKFTDYHIENTYSKDFGVTFPWSGRLKFTTSKELGISEKKIKQIDSIALHGIKEGAYPGCQIVAAVDGKIFYRKSFGHYTYSKKTAINNSNIFDLASITKIGASTTSLMYLESNGKFDVNKKLIDYLPSLNSHPKFGNLGLKEILCHQSGLHPWIPFYLHTIHQNKLDPKLYRNHKKNPFINKVADSLYIHSSYADSMFLKIKEKPLKEKKYKYSDLGYYYIMRIIEKIEENSLDKIVKQKIYDPLGLRSLCFNPLNHFPKHQIIPTENDTIFRSQLLQGYVHDMGSAMLGGVCGHAGLFGNATDLASLFQLFLNEGSYGGQRLIKKSVINNYTKKQFPNNHRAIGFDKKKTKGKSTCNDLASNNSFGHSGFTGTLAWADPDVKLNYVFLSNRVHPEMTNRKIITLDIRREIQRVLYEAIKEAKINQ